MATNPKRKKKLVRKARKSRLGLWTIFLLLVLLGSYLLVLNLLRPHVSGEKLRFDQFVAAATDTPSRIVDARVLDVDSYVIGHWRATQDAPVVPFNTPLVQGGQMNSLGLLIGAKIPLVVDSQTSKRIAGLANVAIPAFMLVVVFGYLILSARRGTGLFAVRSGAAKGKDQAQGVTFGDVAGLDNAVAELREVGEFLSDPARFVAVGATVPRGVLLYGPPGCGKTMLAKALATETNATFFSISGSNFVELYVGVGASRVRNLFKEARESAPSIIFIDELDSIGRARGMVGMQQSHGEQEQALNQILAEMDGCAPTAGVIVIAATNRPDVLDQALLRPGRFDRTIGLERPDEEARRAILGIHARGKKLDPSADLGVVARGAIGLTGAELANVLNEGALMAARAGRLTISGPDLELALQRTLEAPERHKRLALRTRSIGTRFAADEKASFADVAGQDKAVVELEEIKQYLLEPERFSAVGAILPKGVLLYGPPGCGKTLLARALAGEAHAAFFSVGASEFVEAFTGVGASRVRDLFAEARGMPPAIIFIDELDSLGRSRAGGGAQARSNSEQEQTLNQLLAEMDGFSPTDGLLVLAATNRPDVLDSALLRPGRFDRSVGLTLPDEKGRLAILGVHAKSKVLAPDVDLAAIANRAIGLTGADLAKVVNEGALLAVRAGKTVVTQVELDMALQRILAAPGDQQRMALRGKSIGTRYAAEEKVTFADVAGVDDALVELAEVKACLAQPERFAKVGARAPRGVLLSGPPGCGKTLLARAVAGEANAAFFSVSASEFVEVFVGEGAARVRDLFAEAKAMAPAMIFIDEIDAIGARRSSVSLSGNRESEQTLNQILVELDGFEPGSAVVVMAATNRPDILDSALIRPGRFDRRVDISLPDRAGRRAILDVHATGKNLGPDVDLDRLVGITRGFSGADLANVLNEAALLATRHDSDEVTMALIEEGIDRAVLGISSRALVMSEDERRAVAIHEAGHALVALTLDSTSPPHKLTVVPRGSALGHCTLIDAQDRVMVTRSMLVDRMAVMLGGMVAEEMVFGESGSGPAGDLQVVGDIARNMVRSYGLSDSLGPLAYPDGVGNDGRAHTYSDESARAIDTEARRIVLLAKERAQGVLSTDDLEKVAAALLEKETLTSDEFEVLVNVKPLPKRSPVKKSAASGARGASRFTVR